MEIVLRGLSWTNYFVYLEDIIVTQNNFDEDLSKLKKS